MTKIGELTPQANNYVLSLLNCTTWKGRVIAIILVAATVSLLIVSPLFRVAFNVSGVVALIFALFRGCNNKEPEPIVASKCGVATQTEKSVCERQTQVDLISALEMQAYVPMFFAGYPQEPALWMGLGSQIIATGNVEMLAAEFEKVLENDFIHLDQNFYAPWYFWSQETITSFLDLLKANPRLKESFVKIFCSPPKLVCVWGDKENCFSLICRNSNKGVVRAVLQAIKEEPDWKKAFLDSLQQNHDDFPSIADWIYSEGKIDEVIEFFKNNGVDPERVDKLDPLKAKEQNAQFSGMRDLKIEIGSIKRRRHSRQRVSLGHELLEQNLKEEKKRLTQIFLELFQDS